MQKRHLLLAITVLSLLTGCASYSRTIVYKISDPDVIRTVTGKVESIETKHRSALTAINTTASVVTSQQGGSALGLAAFAVDMLDYQAAKSREEYTEIKLINEVSGAEEVWDSDISSLPMYVEVGDRVRLIKKKYGAEASYNLTRFPQKDALTR